MNDEETRVRADEARAREGRERAAFDEWWESHKPRVEHPIDTEFLPPLKEAAWRGWHARSCHG